MEDNRRIKHLDISQSATTSTGGSTYRAVVLAIGAGVGVMATVRVKSPFGKALAAATSVFVVERVIHIARKSNG